MFEQMGAFNRTELFELFKLYTEKGLQATGAGNTEMIIACDKGRRACFEAIQELNKRERYDANKRIGA